MVSKASWASEKGREKQDDAVTNNMPQDLQAACSSSRQLHLTLSKSQT